MQTHGTYIPCAHVSFFTSLEWSLNFCILGNMFNTSFTLRRQFVEDTSSQQQLMLEPLNYFLSFTEPQTAVNVVTIPRTGLRMRFIFMGMLQLVLVPFLLLFMIMHYFLQHAQDWYASRCDQLSFVSCHRHRIGCMRVQGWFAISPVRSRL